MSEQRKNIDKYRLIKVIGEGAMGVVYLAKDPSIDRLVAIKTAHANNTTTDVAERFVQEARTLARCNHPNIVTILDFGQSENLAYMVMEYIKGPDLQGWLKKQSSISIKVIFSIFAQLLKALNKAHSQGIIHRDLKPENILIEAQGRLKLTDFGIAKNQNHAHKTQLGMTMGTPRYMAPEQMFGTDEIGPHTDVYALFVILFRLLRQLKSPEQYDAMPMRHVNQLAKHNRFKPDILVPRTLHDFLLKGLSVNVKDRYTNMPAVARDFKQIIAKFNQKKTDSHKQEDVSGIFTTGTVITQSEVAWRIDDQLFNHMRTDLADLIGPMADFILTHALKNSQSHDQLVMHIAAQLDQPANKEAFIERWREQ